MSDTVLLTQLATLTEENQRLKERLDYAIAAYSEVVLGESEMDELVQTKGEVERLKATLAKSEAERRKLLEMLSK